MRELAFVFFRLGWLGFGGPIAAIAMMDDEIRARRKWLDEVRFAEIYAICKMLPGPVATQVAIALGAHRAGRWGGLLAGLLYIFPSFTIVLALSALYVSRGGSTHGSMAFESLQAAALAVIVMSTIALARPIWANWKWIATAIASAAAVWRFPLWEPVVILCAGLLGALCVKLATAPKAEGRGEAGSLLLDLFWVCFKAGAFVFGTGLAIVPLLEGDVVRNRHWLTHSEFMDGLALGQVTPGPVTITVTFIGYKTAGLAGAFVGTFALFLPCFLNILFVVPVLWKRVSGTPAAVAFTSWALPAVVGGIFATSLHLARATLRSWMLFDVFAVVLAIAWRWKPPVWLLIPGAGLVGALLGRFIG